MSTNEIIENEAMDFGKLFQSISTINLTEISNIRNVKQGQLELDIIRPKVTGMPGGYLYIYEGVDLNHSTFVQRTLIKGNEDIKNFILKSNKVDFTKKAYIIAYGPTWTDDSVTCIAATANIISGTIIGNSPTTLYSLGQNISEVSCFYKVPQGVLQKNSGRTRIIVKSGDDIGRGNEITRRTLSKDAVDSQVVNLDVDLEFGKTYNVGIYMYSPYRYVAGYTFTLAD